MFLLFRPGSALNAGESVTLTGPEERHARVRRLNPRDAVWVGDGLGRRVLARYSSEGQTLLLTDQEERGKEPDRCLLTAVPEGRRWEWLLQKATELGVTRVQPLSFERSVARSTDLNRALRIVEEAARQSLRYRLPEICPALALGEALQRESARLILLDPRGAAPQTLTGKYDEALSFLVGPEGCLSERERTLALEAGAIPLRFGGAILRVETAGLVALAWALARAPGA
ncbi:MAG: 16S rRNA (uracil(1498)-N(3))-methyltransferase [Spirochaetales bacterium]|nr:16S rRNA (uracil(1498)-N(3))-methyltransferase [Leptospiraceae bacterium]MCP5480680.1 16S rRNA (uracil(1498)-N(3))-methyltransferase [Spirochaetales bacterium]MCP5484032.1 16S rRNA (uracil(1498)-N(3))-methyltransferase [Spirochaetales bacterium]